MALSDLKQRQNSFSKIISLTTHQNLNKTDCIEKRAIGFLLDLISKVPN